MHVEHTTITTTTIRTHCWRCGCHPAEGMAKYLQIHGDHAQCPRCGAELSRDRMYIVEHVPARRHLFTIPARS